MTYPTVTFPDAVDVVTTYLAAEIAEPVRTSVPNPRPTSGFVVIHRTGGVADTRVSDAAQLTIECWEDNEADAAYLAQEVRALLHQAQGTEQSGVPIYRVTEMSGPARLPDPATDQERVTFSVVVAMRGAARVVS